MDRFYCQRGGCSESCLSCAAIVEREAFKIQMAAEGRVNWLRSSSLERARDNLRRAAEEEHQHVRDRENGMEAMYGDQGRR